MVLVLALRPLWLLVPTVLPSCHFRTLTGLPCPTCGTAHAAVAMLEGHFDEAFAANPLMSAGALLVLLGGLVAPAWVLLLRRRLPRPPARIPRWVQAGAVAAVMLNWVYLIVNR